MIEHLLIWSALTAVWVLGLTIVTQEDMALHKVRVWAENKNSSIYDPLVLCVWCMPSLHSIVGMGFSVGLGLIPALDWRYALGWPLVIMFTSLLTGSIWSLCRLLMKKADTAEYEEQIAILELQKRERQYIKNKRNEKSNKQEKIFHED